MTNGLKFRKTQTPKVCFVFHLLVVCPLFRMINNRCSDKCFSTKCVTELVIKSRRKCQKIFFFKAAGSVTRNSYLNNIAIY